MSECITLSPESIDAIAAALSQRLAPNHRPELNVAEAMDITGHQSLSAFYRWTTARRVKAISRGRYRRTAILRALGQ